MICKDHEVCTHNAELIAYRWLIYLIGLTWTVPMVQFCSSLLFSYCQFQTALKRVLTCSHLQTPETNYLTLTLRNLGFNTFSTNLLVIPSSVLFILQLLFWTWFSEKSQQRLFVGLVSQLWTIPLIIALEVLPTTFTGSNWARYAISSLIVGYPYAHATLGML